MKKTFRSKIAAAVHEAMAGNRGIGLVGQKTMRVFDASCLTSVQPLAAAEILALRAAAGVSHGVFARYLDVRPKAVSERERGGEEAERVFAEAARADQGQGA